MFSVNWDVEFSSSMVTSEGKMNSFSVKELDQLIENGLKENKK